MKDREGHTCPLLVLPQRISHLFGSQPTPHSGCSAIGTDADVVQLPHPYPDPILHRTQRTNRSMTSTHRQELNAVLVCSFDLPIFDYSTFLTVYHIWQLTVTFTSSFVATSTAARKVGEPSIAASAQ